MEKRDRKPGYFARYGTVMRVCVLHVSFTFNEVFSIRQNIYLTPTFMVLVTSCFTLLNLSISQEYMHKDILCCVLGDFLYF